MLDFDPDEQKVDFTHDDISQMIPGGGGEKKKRGSQRSMERSPLSQLTHLDLLYSNSMWRQSSMPTSILSELFISGK